MFKSILSGSTQYDNRRNYFDIIIASHNAWEADPVVIFKKLLEMECTNEME